jgi:hypothetical protein
VGRIYRRNYEEEKELGHSDKYALVQRGGNSEVMQSGKAIVARFYQLQSGHTLMVQYLKQIGKRSNMNFLWCGLEYQTRNHLFKWCVRWKQG